jgi:hypothetical protein
MTDTAKWPGKLEHRVRDPREEGIQKILEERGIEWNRVRAIAQAVCKPSAPTGRRGSTK